MHAAGGSMGQGVSNAAAITNDVQALVSGFQFLTDFHFHVVELDFHAIKQGIVIGGTGCDFVQCVDHLNNAVQQPLGQHQAQVTGSGVQCGGEEGIRHPFRSRTAATDQVAKPLDDNTATEHIAQAGNAFAIAIGILKRFRKVLGNQQCEVGILRLLGGIFVAVAIDRNDTVGIFVDHSALGIHAESTNLVAVLLGAVNDLALIELVSQVREHSCRQFHTDTDIHTIGLGGNIQFTAHSFHPLAANAADRDNALMASIVFSLALYNISLIGDRYRFHGSIKIEIHLIPQIRIQVFQHHIVNICAQMTYRGVQQMQVVLNAQSFELGAGCGV